MSGVPDYTLESTLDHKFTTRSFSTGAPTTLAGTPVVDIYEDNSVTQITGAETLTVDFDSVTGLNHLRIAATAANGFETGKSYQAVITTGTVGGVSVVGEVVWEFTVGRSAAAEDLANATDGLGAIKAETADILADTADMQPKLGAPAGASMSADIAAIEAQTDDIGAAGAGLTAVPWNAAWDAEVQSEVTDALNAYDPPTNAEMEARTLVAASYLTASDVFTVPMTESYAADGVAPTLEQALFAIQQFLQERAVVGTTVTVNQLDGSTAAMTFTLDDGTSPTSITRAT